MGPTIQSAPHICKRESIPLSLVKINIPTGSIRDKGYGISDYNSGYCKEGVDTMATTNITMRMDKDLKSQLQELVSNLGMDMTTFFTISAKQAVREQRIPFAISMDVPNADTIRAIDDVRHGRNYTHSYIFI